MQPISLEHVGSNQIDQRPQHHRARADQVGHRRQAEIDTLLGVALALEIEWLVHAIFFEQDHGEQARPGKTAQDDMEECGWL